MKKILMLAGCLATMLLNAAPGKVDPNWKLESFCGYRFGSCCGENDGETQICFADGYWISVIARSERLTVPFGRFTDVELHYAGQNRRLFNVRINYALPENWTSEMCRAEVESVRKMLTEKFGVEFVPQGSDRVIYVTNQNAPNNDCTEIVLGIDMIRSLFVDILRRDIKNEEWALQNSKTAKEK